MEEGLWRGEAFAMNGLEFSDRKRRRQKLRALAVLCLLVVLLGGAVLPFLTPLPWLELGTDSPGPMVEVIVQGASGDYLKSLVEAHGGQVTRDLSVVGSVAARVPADRITALGREPGVTRVWRTCSTRL